MGPRGPQGIKFQAPGPLGKKLGTGGRAPIFFPRGPTFYSLGTPGPQNSSILLIFPFTLYLLPYTLLGGAPHPPDPPGLKIHAKLNFQKIPRPNFFKIEFSKNFAPQFFFFNPRGPWGILINPWGPRGPIKNTFKNKGKLRFI